MMHALRAGESSFLCILGADGDDPGGSLGLVRWPRSKQPGKSGINRQTDSHRLLRYSLPDGSASSSKLGEISTAMRILVLADIHSNWHALEAVVKSEPYDLCLFLGDLVDYGVEPTPCVDWVRNNAQYVIRGNHDHGTA